MHFARNMIANALVRMPNALVKNVYYKSETTLPYITRDTENYYIIGQYDTNIAVENGLQFHVDWLKGQKTGFFVDQRENRLLLEKYAKGRKVLNMFCYTGGFSFYAMRGGATAVRRIYPVISSCGGDETVTPTFHIFVFSFSFSAAISCFISSIIAASFSSHSSLVWA